MEYCARRRRACVFVTYRPRNRRLVLPEPGLARELGQVPEPGVGLVPEAGLGLVPVVMVGLIVYTAIIVLCVGGLWMYHLRLLCENKTTNEDIKQTYDRYNPHDHGCCGNCSEVLCSKVRPSHFSAPGGSAEGP